MGRIQSELVVASFLAFIFQAPIVCLFQIKETKDEVMNPALSNCPTCLGIMVAVIHCSVKKFDSRSDKKFSFGRKYRYDASFGSFFNICARREAGDSMLVGVGK